MSDHMNPETWCSSHEALEGLIRSFRSDGEAIHATSGQWLVRGDVRGNIVVYKAVEVREL